MEERKRYTKEFKQDLWGQVLKFEFKIQDLTPMLITLKMMLETLVEKYGWEELSQRIRINCFARNPSIKSSLAFLRKTPWARDKVEALYSASLKTARR